MFEDLKILCGLNGASGYEDRVREYIIDRIGSNAVYSVDNLGNIIAFKKGRAVPKNKIMIDAHMDEVGFIVRSINDDGTLNFSEIGGIDPSTVVGRKVTVGDNGMYGIVGSKPIHNLTKEERENYPSMDSLYIDIGASDIDDAEMFASSGDFAYFAPEYVELSDDMIRSKAIDDRFGCALMLEMIDGELPYDTYFSFSVQEEIGLRGAKVTAYSVNPDIAIVVEATTAADIDNVDKDKQVCQLGKGAVVSFMDKSTKYDKDLYDLAFELAKEKNIPCQTKTTIAGGNNSGAIHTARDGIKTIAVSAPCRYLHSPASVVNKNDIIACRDLISAIIEKAANMDL